MTDFIAISTKETFELKKRFVKIEQDINDLIKYCG